MINKADRDGANRTYNDLVQMLELQAHRKATAWKAPVLMTQASEDMGVAELMARVQDHEDFLRQDGGKALEAAQAARIRQEFVELLKEGVFRHLLAQLQSDGRLDHILADILAKRTDPYSACEALVLATLGPVAPPA